MKVKCVIELEHTGDFDEEVFAKNLQDFIENDEQTYFDNGEIKVYTLKNTVYLAVGD